MNAQTFKTRIELFQQCLDFTLRDAIAESRTPQEITAIDDQIRDFQARLNNTRQIAWGTKWQMLRAGQFNSMEVVCGR